MKCELCGEEDYLIIGKIYNGKYTIMCRKCEKNTNITPEKVPNLTKIYKHV